MASHIEIGCEKPKITHGNHRKSAVLVVDTVILQSERLIDTERSTNNPPCSGRIW